jgi:DNA-binding MarR family transcriptional regulator
MSHYDPNNFHTGMSLGYLLKVNHSLMHDCADSLFSQSDISFVQWIALRKLSERTALTASELCREMRHDNGALTRMLDQLEERGFIERKRSQQDRRVVDLQITPAGLAKVNELTPPLVHNLNNALQNFSSDEFNELIRLLLKLKSELQSYTAQASSEKP